MNIIEVGTGTQTIPPKSYGGTQRVIFSLCRALEKERIDVLLLDFHRGWRSFPETVQDVTIYRIGFPFQISPGMSRLIYGIDTILFSMCIVARYPKIRQIFPHIDAVHFHSPLQVLIFGVFWSLLFLGQRKAKLIYTVHSPRWMVYHEFTLLERILARLVEFPAIKLAHLVIFEYANHLYARGHSVSVIYPLIPMRAGAKWYNFRNLAGIALGVAANVKQGVHVDWFDLEANLIRVPRLAERYIPDADIVVATWWETAYYVSNYGKNKGEKFYLIQHYETWGGPEEKVNKTYKLGLHNIVISTWLKNILQDKLNVPVEAVVPDAVDLDQFYPEGINRSSESVRVLMPYRKEKWKGIEDGIKAFEIAREKHSNIQLVMFGPAPGKDIPPYAEFHEKPYGSKLRKIYNSCDIFVFPSHCEGFGLPPMEAMACKCAVVSTNVGGIPDYAVPSETALVSPPGSPELLAENITKLIEDRELLKRIAEAGYNYIRKFTWDKATEVLEQAFKKALAEK